MPPVTLTLRAIDDEVEPGIYTHYDFALLLPPAAHRDPEGRRRLRRTSLLLTGTVNRGVGQRLLSYRISKNAKRHGVRYSFLFMSASGDQLREIGRLIDSGIIRPVVDGVFPFESTNEAMAYVEKGRAKGEVVVKMR